MSRGPDQLHSAKIYFRSITSIRTKYRCLTFKNQPWTRMAQSGNGIRYACFGGFFFFFLIRRWIDLQGFEALHLQWYHSNNIFIIKRRLRNHIHSLDLNPSYSEVRIFCSNWLNAMALVALEPCVPRASIAAILGINNKRVICLP